MYLKNIVGSGDVFLWSDPDPAFSCVADPYSIFVVSRIRINSIRIRNPAVLTVIKTDIFHFGGLFEGRKVER